MTDPTLDPRDDRLDDVDVPRDPIRDMDEPVVNLDSASDDAATDEVADEESADDKYIQVVDGRPETLGVPTQDSPAGEA